MYKTNLPRLSNDYFDKISKWMIQDPTQVMNRYNLDIRIVCFLSMSLLIALVLKLIAKTLFRNIFYSNKIYNVTMHIVQGHNIELKRK